MEIPPPLSPSIPSAFLTPPAVLKCNKLKLENETLKFYDLANERKKVCDLQRSEKQHRLAILSGLDSLICFLKVMDLEEQAGLRGDLTKTLTSFTHNLANYAKSIDVDLAGLFWQVLAVLHVNSKQFDLAVNEFKVGLTLLPLRVLKNKYEMDWVYLQLGDKFSEDDRAVLPLHVNSSLREAMAFAYQLGKRWGEGEGVRYVFRCIEVSERSEHELSERSELSSSHNSSV